VFRAALKVRVAGSPLRLHGKKGRPVSGTARFARCVAYVERQHITHPPPARTMPPQHAPCVLARARQRM